MQPCKYACKTGCKECKYVYYQSCPNFVKAHAQELAKELLPFKFKPSERKLSIAFSSNIDTIKSIAVERAIKTNTKVKKFSLNQIISLTLSGDDLPSGIYFIDCKQKVSGDLEKLSNVLTSFIDKCELLASPVYIYKPNHVMLNLTDYTKI